ncbi:MAG: hypothetical protein AB1505_29040 [Candidatus Latescibacterota bacterium]
MREGAVERLALGRRPHPRHQSVGNAALLVLVDSGGAYWERSIVDETVLVVLEHLGMPYRLLDLAAERPSVPLLQGCAAILVAQNGVAASLTACEAGLIAEAVSGGAGLVNLDCDVRHLPGALRAVFGFSGVNPHPCATDVLRIRETHHWITGLQDPGEYHRSGRMVTAALVEEWGPQSAVLVEGMLGREQLVYIRHLAPGSAFEPRNVPLVFAARWGQGKAVQFGLNLRLWHAAFLGHARGLDDLLWRSLLWTARKPFATNTVPPFVALSFDDCQGRHDFQYARIAAQHGFVPMPSLLLDRVPERLFPVVREGLASGTLRFGAHALDYYRLLVYDFGRGELDTPELERRFSRHDAFWAHIGALPGPTLRLHWGEYGRRALPFLKARGYRYFCPALQTGLHKADMCLQDGFWPYGLQTCYYDYLPDDPDFFALAAMQARGHEDFLTGCTTYLRESERNDLEKAAQSAAAQIRHGLRAAFHAEIVTHEQKLDALSMAEWDQILGRVDQLSAGIERIHAGHDEIGAYLQGKDGVWIQAVQACGARLSCTLCGQSAVPLRLSVWRDEGEAVVREYVEVTAFAGETAVEVG